MLRWHQRRRHHLTEPVFKLSTEPPERAVFWYDTVKSRNPMAVNIEIKGNLARLLATENLIVEHKQVETAMFDVDRRVLTLPMWQKASNQVYDMLVAHEVGHALFTPFREWNLEDSYKTVPIDYVNVVEDARIERLMKNKFADLSPDFYSAYNELHRDDFFCVNDTDINRMKLIDRINLYFKIGAYLCIDFTDDEEQFVTDIAKAETFDQVLDIAKSIHEYSKEQRKKQQQQQQQKQDDAGQQQTSKQPQSSTDGDSGDDEFESLEQDNNGTEEGNPETGDQQVEKPQQNPDPQNNTDLDKSDTQQSFTDNSNQLVDRYANETLYVTIPELKLDSVIVSFDTIKKYLDGHFEDERKCHVSREEAIMDQVQEYNKFKNSAAKEVNYLVKEFEMKKSADAYARSTTSRTGVLNTAKLHTYKYNEDLFRKVTTIPDGKNHGLVFYLDWSGSMQHIMLDTMKQLFQLVWFCRKVSIPFDVYAFANDAYTLNMGDNTTDAYDMSKMDVCKEWKENDINIDGCFRMINILSSTVKNKDLDKMMQNLWLTAVAFTRTRYEYPRRFSLGGTPLNECIIAAKPIMKEFINKYKLQKCHAIVLTDGEGYGPSHNVVRKTYFDGDAQKGRRPIYSSVIRNSKNGRTYSPRDSNGDFTSKLIEYVKDDIPGVSFIGFRVLERGSLRNFFYWYGIGSQYDTIDHMREDLRKNNSLCMKTKAFDLFFGLQQSSLSVDANLKVDDDASKREISTAFRKMFKGKKTNKFVLQTFVEQIA